MNIRIEPLNLRTATWVAANMQARDVAEIMCQLPPDASKSDAGMACFYASGDGWKWQALVDDSPVACFGLVQMTYTTWNGWGYGLPGMKRVIPASTRHLRSKLPELIAAGCRRIEARALKGVQGGGLWLAALGGKYLTDLEDGGRDGEAFELWHWTLSQHLNKGSPQ